jgi:hypothetical protein
MKYILDLERINQLTAPHPGDNSNGYQPTVVFSVSKSLIKKWVEIWENTSSRHSLENDDKVMKLYHFYKNIYCYPTRKENYNHTKKYGSHTFERIEIGYKKI